MLIPNQYRMHGLRRDGRQSFDSARFGRLPAHDLQVCLVVVAAVRIRCDERAVDNLHGRAEPAALVLADRSACVEHQPIVSKLKLEAVGGLGADDRTHAEGRFEVADRERQQQPLVLQP